MVKRGSMVKLSDLSGSTNNLGVLYLTHAADPIVFLTFNVQSTYDNGSYRVLSVEGNGSSEPNDDDPLFICITNWFNGCYWSN